MSETIEVVVENRLCCQCGTCVAVCPVHAIAMRETPSGLLTASIAHDDCTGCGKCRRVCPGGGIPLDLPVGIDPFRGQVHSAYVGHANDEKIRSGGQSGGVVSALLLLLLDAHQVDAARVSTMPTDGSLRPNATLARTREEILAAQGSKYCPVAANTVLRDTAPGERLAVIGIPCQMHGLHLWERRGDPLASRVRYKIGLFCDRTLLYTCIDRMILNAGLNIEDVAGLEYRSKARKGWPGEVSFHLRSGERLFFPSTLRTRLKEIFTPPRCRLCFDKMNIFCDLAVGDAWGIEESACGDSVILARNSRGVSLLEEAGHQGILTLRRIDPETVFGAQSVERRRQDHAMFMEAAQRTGHVPPLYPGLKAPLSRLANHVTRAKYRRTLVLNHRVAISTTPQSALELAAARQHLDRVNALILGPAWRIGKGLRRICLK